MTRTRNWPAWLAACLVIQASFGSRAETAAKREVSGNHYLIVDYLPQALYEKEPLTICLRIENDTNSSAAYEVTAKLLATRTKVLRSHTMKLEAEAGKFATYQHDHDLRSASRVTFRIKTPNGSIKGPSIRILRDPVSWPDTTVKDGRIVTSVSSEVVLPLVQRRKMDTERSWALVRWAVGDDSPKDSKEIQQVLICIPGAWTRLGPDLPQNAKPDLGGLVPRPDDASRAIRVLGPYAFDGSAPLLRTVGDVLKDLPTPIPERALILLPPEDLQVATDPRTYGIILEAMLVRLVRAGVRRIMILPPIHYGTPKKRQKLLKDAVSGAAKRHNCKVLPIGRLLDEENWRVDPKHKGVYGRRPNAPGRAAIATILKKWLP